ncbi:Hypothetical_protein [Hexamita inflata]|uniref:Hypothetical_protein n=2 Tax=Hexamita inflata TaxID=28002 RepID=A0AA86TTE6_9EUKA|nr:Hypothetical protein HINF_LOCUS15351 [Hexamita inflata]CAI9927715.1 Hypothetical protein HINF_LOCUS15360 [Hexamita inflata]CAI9927719.1 Hypothetical protein HINF_LOCUS15364 [Hexamita inflata]
MLSYLNQNYAVTRLLKTTIKWTQYIHDINMEKWAYSIVIDCEIQISAMGKQGAAIAQVGNIEIYDSQISFTFDGLGTGIINNAQIIIISQSKIELSYTNQESLFICSTCKFISIIESKMIGVNTKALVEHYEIFYVYESCVTGVDNCQLCTDKNINECL